MGRSKKVRLAANYYVAPPGYNVSQFMRVAKEAGAEGVGLTVAALETHGAEGLARLASEHEIFISSLNSAGYFLFADHADRERQSALNKKLIESAVRMRACRLVVITGGIAASDLTLEEGRSRVSDGLAALDAEAGAAGVRLALEPIHPADLTIKGCINSVRHALEIVRSLPSTDIVLDIFHSAWDPDIWSKEVLGSSRLALVQVCDWYEPSPDEKPQRALPGEGQMDLAGWLEVLSASGYEGPIEFEMFDRHRRGRPVDQILIEALGSVRKMIG